MTENNEWLEPLWDKVYEARHNDVSTSDLISLVLDDLIAELDRRNHCEASAIVSRLSDPSDDPQ